MERQLLINLLSEGLDYVDGESGQALTHTLNVHDWVYELDEGDDELIYAIIDDEGDTRYNRYDHNARDLWQRFTGSMQRTFEELVSKQKRSRVGSARLIPFPDKRSPTPAA